MVISAGLKQEQRAPSSYLKAINAPYRPYYISLTFSPFIYIARDFFFVLFCYCFLLSCVKARAALNFFFSFYFGPAGRPRANISLKRGFLRCCWANSNRPFRLAESMDERRRKKKSQIRAGSCCFFLVRSSMQQKTKGKKKTDGDQQRRAHKRRAKSSKTLLSLNGLLCFIKTDQIARSMHSSDGHSTVLQTLSLFRPSRRSALLCPSLDCGRRRNFFLFFFFL